jgi:hypothetical protein
MSFSPTVYGMVRNFSTSERGSRVPCTPTLCNYSNKPEAGACVERLDVLAIIRHLCIQTRPDPATRSRKVLAVNNRKRADASPRIIDSITPEESASLRENQPSSRCRADARLTESGPSQLLGPILSQRRLPPPLLCARCRGLISGKLASLSQVDQ